MKEIYQKILNTCNENEKKIIFEFEQDHINLLSRDAITEKYNLTQDDNQNEWVYLTKKIKKKQFTISIDHNEISFSTQSNFRRKHYFSMSFSYDLELKKYHVEFSIQNKTNDLDALHIKFLMDSGFYNVDTEFSNLQIPIKSKETSAWSDNEFYILGDRDVVATIIDNFNSHQDLKDIILLKHDLNVENDEIIAQICKHSIIINKMSEKKIKKRICYERDI